MKPAPARPRSPPASAPESEWLEAILRRVLRQDQIAEQRELADLRQAWEAALGPLAAATRLLSLRRGVLVAAVAGPAVMYEIKSFKEHELLSRLRDACPKRAIRRLRLVVMALDGDPEAGMEKERNEA